MEKRQLKILMSAFNSCKDIIGFIAGEPIGDTDVMTMTDKEDEVLYNLYYALNSAYLDLCERIERMEASDGNN